MKWLIVAKSARMILGSHLYAQLAGIYFTKTAWIGGSIFLGKLTKPKRSAPSAIASLKSILSFSDRLSVIP